jgi:hypothetical protein
MTSQAVMKRYINALAKKNQSNPELQKLSTAINNFKKLTKEQQSKVNKAVETAYEKLQAKGVSVKKVVTKPTTASKPASKANTGLKPIVTQLKNQLGASSFKAATTNTNIAKDIKLPALKKGKRIVRNAGKTTNQYGTFENKVGSTYYESRANRYDANQPSTTRKYKLAKGGEISKSPIFEDGVLISKPFYFEEKGFFGLSKSYKITNQWDENVTAHFIISKNLDISKKDALDKANAFYNFCKKAKTWEQYENLSSKFIEDWNSKKMADGGEIENSQRMQEIIDRRVEISDYINKKYGQSRGKNKAEKKELEALGKEYRMLGYEYDMRKNGEFAKGGMTGDALYIDQLASMSGASPATIKLWAIDENHLSKDELLNIIQGLGRNQINRFQFLNAVLGDEERTSEIIAYAKSNKGFKMADGGSLGEVKVGDYFINTTNGEKFYIEKIDKKDKSYPFYVIKSKPTDLPEVISFDEWYRYSKNGLFEKVDEKYAKGGEIAEGNYEMILSQAKEVQHHAKELQDILKGEKEIEAWVVAKMENVSSTLSDITHYLDGKTEYADGGETANSKNKKIMEEYRVEVSDLRNQSYPRMSPSLAFKKASEYMLFRYTKEELAEAIKNDRQIEMFGMEKTWLNALAKAKKPSKMADGGEISEEDILDKIQYYRNGIPPKGHKYALRFKGKVYSSNDTSEILEKVMKDLKENKMAKGGEIEKPLSYYKYETPKVRIAWKGRIQPLGMFKSAEEAYEVIEERSNGIPFEREEFSIVTPDKVIHLGKEYKIIMAKGGTTKRIKRSSC